MGHPHSTGSTHAPTREQRNRPNTKLLIFRNMKHIYFAIYSRALRRRRRMRVCKFIFISAFFARRRRQRRRRPSKFMCAAKSSHSDARAQRSSSGVTPPENRTGFLRQRAIRYWMFALLTVRINASLSVRVACVCVRTSVAQMLTSNSAARRPGRANSRNAASICSA